jgi:hypothetical protein
MVVYSFINFRDMKKGMPAIILLIALTLMTIGCSPKARYERKVKHELARGVRNDSLFMGFYLGMPQKDFYTHCWELNHKGLIRQGTNNTSVEYKTDKELKFPGTMNFYPKFADGKISEMPVQFVYNGWAPWNTNLSTDNLEADVLNWYKKIYGGSFISVRHPEEGTAYIQVNGNRRITIYKGTEPYVWAVFTDLTVKKDSTETVINKENNQ